MSFASLHPFLQSTRERVGRRAFTVSSPDEHLKRASAAGDLHKCLGLAELTFLGTGSIIGAGVFVLSGVAANESAGPAVIVSYAVAALAALLSAFAYAEFACDVPVAGGAFNYVSITFGELAAWTTGWNMVLETTLSSAAVARGFASYLATLLGLDPAQMRIPVGPFQLDFVALGLICVLSTLLAAGTQQSARFNMGVSLTNITCILFVLSVGFPQGSAANLTPFWPYGVRGMFGAASMVFFSYVGFDFVANAAEEAKNPTRDMPISIVSALAIAAVLYGAMSTAIVMMVPYTQINVHAPFSAAFLQHGMAWAARIVSVGALLGIVTSTMTGLLSNARLFVVLGRQCLLPSWLAGVHRRRGTPVRATVATAILSGSLTLLLNIDVLAELVSIGTLYVFCFVCAGVLFRRYHQPGSPYAANALWRIVAIAAASAGFSLTFTFGAPWPLVALLLLLWLAATLSCLTLPVAYQPPGYRVPFFPLAPALGMLLTIHLIASLGWPAYVRFGVWMAVGLVIYSCYGVHAAEEREAQERSRSSTPDEEGEEEREVELPPFASPRLPSLDYEGPLHGSPLGSASSPWTNGPGAGASDRARLLGGGPASDGPG